MGVNNRFSVSLLLKGLRDCSRLSRIDLRRIRLTIAGIAI